MNSRSKGARGEREIAALLREYGYNTRRGQQYSGASGDPDVVGLPGIHIEVKRRERLDLYAAMEQAVRDHKPDTMPTVMHRKNGEGWLVTMRLDDWMQLYIEADSERYISNNAQK